MKKQILNFGKTLSRVEQQQINGGHGTCGYFNGATGEVTRNLSRSQAEGSLAHASDHWCCDSCYDTSWFIQPIWTYPDTDEEIGA